MRIGIDAHMIGKREGGNETYVRNLINSLARIDDKNCYVIFVTDKKSAKSLNFCNRNFVIDTISPNNIYRLGVQFYNKQKKHCLDLMHFTYHMPLILQSKSIITIHDLSFKKHPNFFNFKNRLIFSAFGKLSAEKADSIITVSNSSKRDIIEFYHIVENKVWVTYLAANEDYINLDKNRFEVIREKYKIDSKFVLSIGSFEPKKNLWILLKAFKKIITENAIEHHLLIVHRDMVGINEAFRQMKLLDILDRSNMIPYVDSQDLPYLYALADVFVYPSIYEGFGLPVLEAMTSGVPVVCSNTSSLPEVVNDSALTFDPYDVKGLSKAMLTIIKNPILRQRMIQKGIIRARQFSWDKTAYQTLMVYSSVCGVNNK